MGCYSNMVHGCQPEKCKENYTPCECDDMYDSCYYLEKELKDMLECLIRTEEHMSKKIDKAREYQEQVGVLIAKAMEAQCKANELLDEVDYLDNETSMIKNDLFKLMFKTIDCYKNDICTCSCKCRCKCNKR